MLHTSIGFHTFSIFIKIDGKEATELFRDFERYRDTTNEIVMYVPDNEKDRIRNAKKLRSKGIKVRDKPTIWKIDYVDDHTGIAWTFRFNNHSTEYKEYIVEAKINPKILVGIVDYVTAANEDYLDLTEKRFNKEAKKISKILGKLSWYKTNRIDYCINFDLKEMNIGCIPWQMIQLIKRGDTPHHFNEWQYYNETSHRKKSGAYSHYLKSGSVNINCYYKYKQLEKNYPDCPNINDSLHVIRFEVQCKYSKIRYLTRNDDSMYTPLEAMKQLLSDHTSGDIIEYYYRRIIGHGNYYALKDAIEIVESHHFHPRKEQRLVDTLKLINQCRGIAKTRLELEPAAVEPFNRSLKQLGELGINPVTIPKSYGIRRIPNLLDTYYKMKEAGTLPTVSLIDPFESINKPFETTGHHRDNDGLFDYEQNLDTDHEEYFEF